MINVLFGALLLVSGGCGYRAEQGAPEVVGKRTNSLGAVSEEIIRTVDKKIIVLPSPDGSSPYTRYRVKYFFQEGNGPRFELTFVSDKRFHDFTVNNAFTYCDKYWAVDSSRLWLGTGIDPMSSETGGHDAVINGHHLKSFNGRDLHVVVFDTNHILTHRTFKIIPKWESEEDEFKLDNGNQTAIINTTTGQKKYQVVEDAVVNLEKNPN